MAYQTRKIKEFWSWLIRFHFQIDKYAPEPKTFGECKLPITPANDPDIDRNSGLRFGNFPVYKF